MQWSVVLSPTRAKAAAAAASITGRRYAIRNKCYHPSILPPPLHPSNDTKSPGPPSRLESFYKDSYNTLEIRRKEGRSEGTNERTEEKRKKRRDEIFFPRAQQDAQRQPQHQRDQNWRRSRRSPARPPFAIIYYMSGQRAMPGIFGYATQSRRHV